MRQIGQAMMLYATENQGAFPPRPEDLLLSQPITSDVFVCPSTTDTKAPGTSAVAAAAKLSAGGHLSFIYVGAGLNSNATPDTILLYEPITNHSGDGINVLYGDGHVEFQSKAEANRIINELKLGHNPPAERDSPFTDDASNSIEK